LLASGALLASLEDNLVLARPSTGSRYSRFAGLTLGRPTTASEDTPFARPSLRRISVSPALRRTRRGILASLVLACRASYSPSTQSSLPTPPSSLRPPDSPILIANTLFVKNNLPLIHKLHSPKMSDVAPRAVRVAALRSVDGCGASVDAKNQRGRTWRYHYVQPLDPYLCSPMFRCLI
jgi:hypothetical protein